MSWYLRVMLAMGSNQETSKAYRASSAMLALHKRRLRAWGLALARALQLTSTVQTVELYCRRSEDLDLYAATADERFDVELDHDDRHLLDNEYSWVSSVVGDKWRVIGQ